MRPPHLVINRKRVAIATATFACVLVALGIPAGGLAVDINHDGLQDSLLREQPNLPSPNVGSNCDVWANNSPEHYRLYVRPPIVWGLPHLGRQLVAWRTRFYDIGSGQIRAYGHWHYARVRPREWTIFGGGPNVGNGVTYFSTAYWQGGEWYDHLAGDGDQIRALIDVGWYKARTRRWIIATQTVHWVVPSTNRTLGLPQGLSGYPYPPFENGSC
jgi:hypothetical protein